MNYLIRNIKKVLFVIVLYNNDLKQSITFNSMTKNLEKLNLNADIIVYDNTFKPIYKNKKPNYPNWNITYIHDKKNSGVSKAYNKAAKIAKKNEKEWIFLLDQDTMFPEDSLVQYLRAIDNFDSNLFVPKLKVNNKIYSPANFFLKRGFPIDTLSKGFHDITGKTILNSGVLIKLETFEIVGGFNEKIKLDFSDIYFFEKYKRYYTKFYLLDVECKHGFSDNENGFKSSLTRYKFFCDGAIEFSNNFFSYINLFLIVFLRGIKFSLRFKTIDFMKIFINHFLLNKKNI